MATPNMATITAALERSLQNCSLNHQHSSSSSSSSASGGAARPSDSPPGDAVAATLELNSEGSLPFHWEQCLDLKSGEIYYINWRTGMKATEDPRTAAAEYGGECYSEEDSSSYDSDGSSSESSPCSSREQWSGKNNEKNSYYEERNEDENNSNPNPNPNNNNSNVLVVAGCKSCLMYYMVPKQLEICPKCCGQLLHFDRSENTS
ncbi:protein CURLY FLAG LEAF 1-like [Salvia miltiorrhiza]|uniref:protein CURLY FLAG LEAF 1-like n=1 Tax=Salvia miltiorrhiza TaxID=226208 RepID=UPI0025AC5F9A|nr:protein CURLY FLAG LEAF 1-like [Salvia miltiorrhiza]